MQEIPRFTAPVPARQDIPEPYPSQPGSKPPPAQQQQQQQQADEPDKQSGEGPVEGDAPEPAASDTEVLILIQSSHSLVRSSL